MSLVSIACPNCGHVMTVERTFLTADGADTACTECQNEFTFSAEDILPDTSRHTLSLQFNGTGKEYFGIWIVNILLQVVTLGLYSPWAKVRRRHYFYSNTLLDEEEFQYLANPIAILKGWLIAGSFFILYSGLSRTYPGAANIVMLLFFAIYPCILVRSRMFSCANSTYRNIRFRFARNYAGAYREYLLMPMLLLPTVGLIAPYIVYRQKRFLVENTSFGATPFTFEGRPKDFYRAFFHLFLIVALLIVVAWQVVILLRLTHHHLAATIAILPFILIIYFVFLVYLPTELANITWSATSIGTHRFSLSQRVVEVGWIKLSNAVLTILSLGLLAPWCAVRLARYQLGKLTMAGAGSLDSIVAGSDTEIGATGEELGDLLGFDFGL